MRHVSLPAAIILILLVGCTSVRPTLSNAPPSVASEPAPPPKTLVVAVLTAFKGYQPMEFGLSGGGGATVAEIHTAGLVSEDDQGARTPRLAAKLPSLDDGSIVLLPDGRMQTTWELRPGVTWHDGTPLSADDLLFSFEVIKDPELVPVAGAAILRAEAITATGPSTVVATWKAPYFDAVNLNYRGFWLFPKHLLGDAFENDKPRFYAHRYFTTDYVHLGPFRLVDFGMGEQQVFERYDGYFLGRPRVTTIIVRTFGNPQALVAAFKAGAIDIVAEKTLPGDMATNLRDEWMSTGEGLLLSRQDNWLYGAFQFGDWARPIELSQDVRLRRGLYQAIDREAIRDALVPGFADTSGDTFMHRGDPRTPLVGEPFARYRYDPTTALRELAAAGWRRGTDGRLVNQDGRPVQLEVVGANDTWTKEVALVADSWRQLGVDASELIPARAVALDIQRMATYPGVMIRARGSGEGVFPVFDSRIHPGPANRWTPGNMGYYVNPALDQLIDTLYRTIDERQQGMLLKEMGEIIATDLPAMPLYYRTNFAAVHNGVRALEDYTTTRDPWEVARSAHLWDRA
jgi:peptide/nickel transport system substrate-binding protein